MTRRIPARATDFGSENLLVTHVAAVPRRREPLARNRSGRQRPSVPQLCGGSLVDRARNDAPVGRVHAVPESPLRTDRVSAIRPFPLERLPPLACRISGVAGFLGLKATSRRRSIDGGVWTDNGNGTFTRQDDGTALARGLVGARSLRDGDDSAGRRTRYLHPGSRRGNGATGNRQGEKGARPHRGRDRGDGAAHPRGG